MKKKTIRSTDLGIDLGSGRERELFRWFLACLLFGKPIQQEIARSAFEELSQAGLDSPVAIRNAGWQRLVELLDRAHYVRYDFSTATKLLDVSEDLNRRHETIRHMITRASTPAALGEKLREFRGVGPVTARIFLRDLRPYWKGLHQ